MKTLENTSFNMSNINQSVELYGWVAKKRDLGGMLFIDLRDHSGIIQLVVKPELDFYKTATNLKNESVIRVVGIIKERDSKNPNLPTGDIEVDIEILEVLSMSEDLPFEVSNEAKALEDTRLKYRYLDLRRRDLTNNLKIRHQVTMLTRNYLNDLGFLEIETPMLTKSTPEGARDYLVPSRVNKGNFYALPQSPQIFKQLLMIGGLEKYFQIVKCFRDEDLRADRQPEFTQIDLEMSFVNEEDIIALMEGYLQVLFREVKNYDLEFPIKRLTYAEAISKYGTDKPDLRFGLELIDVKYIFRNNNLEFIKNADMNAIILNNHADLVTRKQIDEYTAFIKKYGCDTLIAIKYENNELTGSIVKNLSESEKLELISELNLTENDLVLIGLGNKELKQGMGALRLKLGRDFNLINRSIYSILWVTDFPMFEYNEEEQRYVAMHHPFTAPTDDSLDNLTNHPELCQAKAYDLVINGSEVGGGSIRIHQSILQSQVFNALKISEEEANNKFGFLIEALKYGAPPHGGIALGLDRLIMILTDTENVRDVIAFPKTSNATCLLSKAPGHVSLEQLTELGIKVTQEGVKND